MRIFSIKSFFYEKKPNYNLSCLDSACHIFLKLINMSIGKHKLKDIVFYLKETNALIILVASGLKAQLISAWWQRPGLQIIERHSATALDNVWQLKIATPNISCPSRNSY
jgi:hypothetical protein